MRFGFEIQSIDGRLTLVYVQYKNVFGCLPFLLIGVMMIFMLLHLQLVLGGV